MTYKRRQASVGSIPVNSVMGAPSTIVAAGTTAATATIYISFTLPVPGTWSILYVVRGVSGPQFSGISSVLYDDTGTLIPNTELLSCFSSGADSIQSTATGMRDVATSQLNSVFTLRIFSPGLLGGMAESNADGRSYVAFRKIG